MPATAIINMRALTGGRMPRSFHCLVHPLFLDRISEADADLGKALHDSGGMAPYSISPVMGKKIKGSVLAGESYWVRICMLDETLEDAFLRTLEKGFWNEPLYFGELSFMVEDVVLGEQDGNVWSGRTTYQELGMNSCGREKISLRFASPTSFKRGDMHYPLPEPVLVFHNLIKRWNAFSPPGFKAPDDLNFVSFSFLDIRTERYSLRKGGTVLGFVGDVTLHFNVKDKPAHYFGAILDFAFYSGIGVKTTQGMGMCRVIG